MSSGNQAPPVGPDGLCTAFGVRVRWGAFVPAFPGAMQTKVTIGVPGLPPVTLLLTRGLTPQAPWGDLARQACQLYHAGRGITDQRADLGRLWTWLCRAGHREAFNQAWSAGFTVRCPDRSPAAA